MASKIGHSVLLMFTKIILASLLQRFNCTPIGQSSRTVFPVDSCPRNLSEVEDASKRLNCSGIDNFKNTYHCLPFSDLSQLVELCYQTSYLVEKGNCMVLQSGFLNNRSCLHFTEGCPGTYYDSKRMLNFPACTEINRQKRCYLADPACPVISSDFNATTVSTTINITLSKDTSLGEKSGGKGWIAIPAIIPALVIILVCAGFALKRKCHRKANKDVSADVQIGIDSLKNRDSETEALLSESSKIVIEQLSEGDEGHCIENNAIENQISQNSEAEALLLEACQEIANEPPSDGSLFWSHLKLDLTIYIRSVHHRSYSWMERCIVKSYVILMQRYICQRLREKFENNLIAYK